MRWPRTLWFYIVREVLSYTALGLLAIMVMMVGQNLFRFLDRLIGAGFALADFTTIAVCLVMMLATYAVPIAFLFGVLLAFGRIAADSEFIAMQVCGMGFRTIIQPVAVLGVVVSGLTAYLTLEVEHNAHLTLRQAVKTMAARYGFIMPGRFQRLGDRVVFVRNIDPQDQLEGILISDVSNSERPLLILAEHGGIDWDSATNQLIFHLTNGEIHVDSEEKGTVDDNYLYITFLSFDYTLDAQTLFGRNFATLRPREMTIPQLDSVIERARRGESLHDLRRHHPAYYQLQIHRRFALPVAPLLFAIVGGALGFERRRGARSWGALFCISIVFAYYAILTFSELMTINLIIPAVYAMWIPNALFLAVAVWLYFRASRMRN